MAEESKADESNKAETPAANSNNKGRNNNNKKDETPIEELYDLSKPLPKVGHGPGST
jgi:hypothetical protein